MKTRQLAKVLQAMDPELEVLYVDHLPDGNVYESVDNVYVTEKGLVLE